MKQTERIVLTLAVGLMACVCAAPDWGLRVILGILALGCWLFAIEEATQ